MRKLEAMALITIFGLLATLFAPSEAGAQSDTEELFVPVQPGSPPAEVPIDAFELPAAEDAGISEDAYSPVAVDFDYSYEPDYIDGSGGDWEILPTTNISDAEIYDAWVEWEEAGAFNDWDLGSDPDEDYIVGGRKANIKEVPHQVLMLVLGRSGSRTVILGGCGGSIVRSNIVVTAAHCAAASGAVGYALIAGDRAPKANGDTNGQLLISQRRLLHPKYTPGVPAAIQGGWDIALLRTDGNFKYSEKVRPIRIATGAQVNNAREGIVSGWGRTGANAPASLGRAGLKLAKLPILRDSQCSRVREFDAAREICAGSLNRFSRSGCNGDSGGPLTIKTAAGPRLAGIVSYGASTCNSLSVFIQTSAFRKWMFNNLPKARCDGRAATVDLSLGMEPTNKADVIAGTGFGEKIRGLRGNDRICGFSGNDIIEGGLGFDRIFGGKGNDKLFGNQGKDRLAGGLGVDVLNGGQGKDNCLPGGQRGDKKTAC